MKKLFKYLKPYMLPTLLAPLFMLLEVAMDLMQPALMSRVIDVGVANADKAYIVRTCILMFVCALLGVTGGLGNMYFSTRAGYGFARDMRSDLYRRIQSFSFSDIDRFKTGSLVTRTTNDVTQIQNAFTNCIRMLVRAPFLCIGGVVMVLVLNAKLSLVVLAAIPFLTAMIVFLLKRGRPLFTSMQEKLDRVNTVMQENLSGIRVVKAYVREPFETNKFHKAAQNIYDRFLSAEKILSWNMPLMNFTVYTSILLISWLGANFIVAGSLTTGELMNLLTYCMSILMSLMMLSMIFVMVSMSTASAQRICAVLDEQPDLTNPEHPVFDIPDGSVEFRHVDFAYRKDAEKPVLRDIDLKVTSGETIGIIGGTGSAKTSLVNLISRLYDVTAGQVLVGGRDVREYDLETLRNEVSVVLQKNVLFSGTILENLRWGDEHATLAECQRACRLACADEFIEKMPDGYDTYIEPGGTNVSGGQRQRLCIARALLKKPKVLILDDSTSAVDTATDAKIRRAFAQEIPDTTKFIIAQRVSSVQDADRILVMDEGQISGFGTHEELLQTNAIYQEVYESQTNGGGDFDEGGEG